MTTKNENESIEKSINDTILSSSAAAPANASRRKFTTKIRNNGLPNVNSYEQHLEKWLESTSKMNFDHTNLDGNMPFMNVFSAFQQPTNRKGNSHLQQFGAIDPILLPSHMQYQHLLNRQQSQSPISNDPLTSISTQQDFLSLPIMMSQLNADRIPSTDQEKLNDVINQTRRFNDLLIDDTPNAMSASNNSTKANELSFTDELDDDDDKDEKAQNGESRTDLNNKALLMGLLKQINLLHETNSKIFRNLQETKVEMEALKYAPSWGLRHRRDSVSGLSVHSQQFGYGGMASPTPTYLSQGGSNYPGIVTDLIREVRDAGRIRDESLMNRVKALIDEKSWALNESNMRVLRELEEAKVHLHSLKLERQNTNDRLSKLEDEVRSIKSFLGTNANQFQQYSKFPVGSNMNEQMQRSNMNLSYGVINSTCDGYVFDENLHTKRFVSQSPQQRQENSYEPDDEAFEGSHLMQMEKDTFKLRRDLQEAIASKRQAENRVLALEHLVTSLKSPTQATNTNPNHSNSHAINVNKNSSPSDFHPSPSQHQLRIQINSGEPKRKQPAEQRTTKTTLGGETTVKLSSPKSSKASQVTLSAVPGPVTDL